MENMDRGKCFFLEKMNLEFGCLPSTKLFTKTSKRKGFRREREIGKQKSKQFLKRHIRV